MKLPRDNLYLKIVSNNSPGKYAVYVLQPRGKHNETLGCYTPSQLLIYLQKKIYPLVKKGLISSIEINVEGSLLAGEGRLFTDISELVEALRLKQGVGVEL